MPSKSPAQAKLMRAVAHGWKKPGGGGPSPSVAKEFMHADQKAKGYGLGGIASRVVDTVSRAQDPNYDPITEKYGTEPITGAQAKKSSGKSGIAGTLGAFTQLTGAGWTPVTTGPEGDFDTMTWYPPQGTLTGGLEGATQTGGYNVPQPSTRTGTDFDEGSIAADIYAKYGIVDPTWTEYDRTSQEKLQADPYAHLGADDPARAEYEGWDRQREEMDRVRGLAAYPEMPGKQSPQREQLRQHKARVADILSGGGGGGNVVAGGTPGFYQDQPALLEEEEPVEMQAGGLAQAMGQQRGSMGRRGSPQMMQAMQRRTGRGQQPQRGGSRGMARQMAQDRGRGRSPQRQMMQQRMAQRRGGQGRVGPMRGPQRMQMPGRGMAQPGGPGGMPGGRDQMISPRPSPSSVGNQSQGIPPDDARMPGGRAMPLRGFQQKQAMQRRGNLGGNRVGPGDQQGGLARAMQKQTGRPPISRRSAFPGRDR